MKEKPKKVYKIINRHPTYSSEEERQEFLKQCTLALAREAEYLRILYPDQKF